MQTLYGIHNCDSCKKARHWLDQHNIPYVFHDFRADGLSLEHLNRFAEKLDWNILLNRNSSSWRQLRPEQQSDLTQEKVLALMLETPTLIKRPILDTGKKLVVGFKSGNYTADL